MYVKLPSPLNVVSVPWAGPLAAMADSASLSASVSLDSTPGVAMVSGTFLFVL